ncbi:MAG: STAS domain-containing protein [Nitrosomonadales bacterium]|nr:STAS domain-containing protein [Nitrosomonadales bacterium]
MIKLEGDRLVLQGRLTIATVPALFEAGLKFVDGQDLLVDFSQVEAVDSAAISMLLGWTRAARSGNRKLSVTGLPEDLLSLAQLYGVAELLPGQPV